MADLRARLADALREHQPQQKSNTKERPGYRIWRDGCSGCDWLGQLLHGDEHLGHIADVLLSLPGIAIVELPEPTGSEPATEDENGFVEWEYPHGAVQVFDGGVIGWGRWHFEDATKLREAASALLAAANAAEEQKNER